MHSPEASAIIPPGNDADAFLWHNTFEEAGEYT